jgi:GNAT superfamily N-acetyltransferase
MVAVAPGCQRAGVGTSLVHRAVAEIKAVGVGLAVIGTGGDPGHAPARALYEKAQLQCLPPREVLPQALKCGSAPSPSRGD